MRILKTEQEQQHGATASSLEALSNFEARYAGGLELYIDVVSSQTAADGTTETPQARLG